MMTRGNALCPSRDLESSIFWPRWPKFCIFEMKAKRDKPQLVVREATWKETHPYLKMYLLVMYRIPKKVTMKEIHFISLS